LLEDAGKLKAWQKAVESRGLFVSAFASHGNPLHPDKSFGDANAKVVRQAILLAEKTGVPCITTFAGTPGGCATDKTPNWITCAWPPYFSEMVQWQWKERIVPFWKEMADFAAKHGGIKMCFEMHPGDFLYCPERLLHLRETVGPLICCNFDPSHLFWQGIDPIVAVRKLGEAIQHTHAKDTRIDPINTSLNGVLDTKPYTDEINRSWIFRTVGYGHGVEFWKDFVSTLRLVGYDYVLSIEHEDSLMSPREGLSKAVALLREAMIVEKPGAAWWT
jgi:sugar phosphate isomerase/epimerase